MSTSNKIVRSESLSVGDDMAAFTKVAMAHQMGKDLADILFEKKAYGYIKHLKQGLKHGTSAGEIQRTGGKLGFSVGHMKETEKGLKTISEATGTSLKQVLSRGTKNPALDKGVGAVSSRESKGLLSLGVNYAKGKINLFKGRRVVRQGAEANKILPRGKGRLSSSNRVPTEGAADVVKKKWFEDSRVWAGIAGGSGAGLIGSAALGN